jgi:hypothetical protein
VGAAGLSDGDLAGEFAASIGVDRAGRIVLRVRDGRRIRSRSSNGSRERRSSPLSCQDTDGGAVHHRCQRFLSLRIVNRSIRGCIDNNIRLEAANQVW